MKNYLITESQLERITNLIISEQSVVGAPNFGTIGSSDRFTNKKNETKPIKGFDCVPYAFRYPSSNLKGKGYNPLFIKASLGTIGRESSFGEGNRYNFLNPLKTLASHLGASTSIGYGQIKPETAKQYGMKIQDLNTALGSLTTIYKILFDNYKKAKQVGFTDSKSVNVVNGTGNAALDMAIVAYNAGATKIAKYCQTSNPKIKRDCKLAGKTIDGLKVTNKPVINYVPNFKTTRWDGVNISSHGYVQEVAKRMKTYGCF
jgi:hypothetical protein